MGRTAMRYRSSAVMAAILVATAAAGSCRHGGRVEPARFSTTAEREHELMGRSRPRLGGPEGDARPEKVRVNRTPPLNDDIESLDEQPLVDYLNSLTWDLDPLNIEIENAECVHASQNNRPCVAPESARVVIQPEIGSFKLSWTAIAQLPHGLVVGRIINYDTGDRKERVLGFPADSTAWWVVDQDPAQPGKLRSRYFRRTYSASRPFVAQVGITRDFIYCDHQHKQGHGKAIAKFVTCSQSLTMETPGGVPAGDALVSPPRGDGGIFRAASLTSAMPVPRHPMLMALSGTWITCDMGCCSTSR
jgi:hypothetical protein